MSPLVGDGVDTPGLPVGGEGEATGLSGADDVITATSPPGDKVNVTEASFVPLFLFKKSSSRSA